MIVGGPPQEPQIDPNSKPQTEGVRYGGLNLQQRYICGVQ
jgi:hypothetical protein